MFTYLENLRHKSVSYRKRVVLVATIAIMVPIVFIWIGTWSFGVHDSVDPKVFQDSFKPIEELKTNVGSFYGTLSEISRNILGGAASSSRR